MNDMTSTLWDWVRSRIEISAVVSIVVGVSTYVGDVFYKSYFQFYNIFGADIKIPVIDGIRTFAVILVVSVCLISLVASARLRTRSSFSRALFDNVPLFIIVIFLSAWAVGFYWQNVNTLSPWLSALVTDPKMRAQNQVLTAEVTHFLERAILIAPFVIATIVVISLSAFGLSFSAYLMQGSARIRLVFLAVYVVFAISIASACGRVFAFLEFSGAFQRPDMLITLDDGKIFQEGSSIYLIMETDGNLYVSKKPSLNDKTVKSWAIAKSNIKSVEYRAAKLDPTPLLDYLN